MKKIVHWLHAFFYGTIQNYRYCKECWSKYVKNKLHPKMDVLLTMSTYQLLFLDKVPSYAIVNDAVNIAKKINVKYAGLTNAVLHKVKPIETDNVALKYSLPDWLYKMWASQYGQEKALMMASASVNILPMYVRRNTLMTSEADFIWIRLFVFKIHYIFIQVMIIFIMTTIKKVI